MIKFINILTILFSLSISAHVIFFGNGQLNLEGVMDPNVYLALVTIHGTLGRNGVPKSLNAHLDKNTFYDFEFIFHMLKPKKQR